MMIFGIAGGAFNKIISTFKQNNNIEQVILFGSRAMGRYSEGSDIDLSLKGENLKLDDQLDLAIKLEKLDYPYTYDINIFKNITNIDLIEHIERVGIAIYDKNLEDETEWRECR